MTTTLDRAEQPAVGGGYETVASMVHDRAKRSPNVVAMREKDFGIWQEITWSDLWESIELAAHGLLALGLEVSLDGPQVYSVVISGQLAVCPKDFSVAGFVEVARF